MPSPIERDTEIEEAEHQIRKINRFLRRAPWLGVSVFAAIPIGHAFGDVAGWLAALAAATCTGVALYIPAMHRVEHRQRLHKLREAKN